jgi:anaerobic magnesium-protoporphyrin IX monomethyl ester cyclase
MAKIALVVPNFLLREQFGEISDPPIGVASIGGYLERHGHEVLIVDGMGENIQNPEIIDRLTDFKPRYVGIACNYCTLHNSTLLLAKTLKEAFGRSIFIFVGGNHATSLAGPLLTQSGGDVDCIARGEGETTTLALVEALEAGEALTNIPGLSFLEGGAVVNNTPVPLVPDLDELGIPAYHLLPMDCYRRYNITSMRGCPYSCSFCASVAIFSRRVRYRSPDSVVAEIEYLLTTYGDRHFWFSDDTFTVNRAHTAKLLGAIMERDFRLTWSCVTTVNNVKADLLEMMRDSGCKYISYGIETGNPGLLSHIGKRISIQDIKQTSHLTHSVGLAHYGFFIFGFPGETWDTVYDTYKLIYESELDGGGMNILIPLPGTRLWQDLYEEQKMFTLDEMKWDELFARLPNEVHRSFPAQLASRWCSLSPDELLEACKIGHRMFAIARHIKGG